MYLTGADIYYLDRIFIIIHRLYKVLHCYTTEWMATATLSTKSEKLHQTVA
jgi:hypothetical protein